MDQKNLLSDGDDIEHAERADEEVVHDLSGDGVSDGVVGGLSDGVGDVKTGLEISNNGGLVGGVVSEEVGKVVSFQESCAYLVLGWLEIICH